MSHATTLAGPPGVLLFSDMFYGGAVLQRDEPVTVWGWSGGTNVTVTLGPGAEGAKGYSAGAAVNASRVWLLRLPAQPSGWNRTLSVQDGTGSITVNVSFGETVLCVGQSNMGMQVGPSYRGFDADNASAESAASVRYTGRIFLHSSLSRWKAAASRHGDRDSTVWYPVTPESIKNFSAVCWYTGRTLFDTLGGEVPVGLAMNAVGGHAVESWLGPRQLEACRISTPCTAQQPLSKIWNATIIPMQPYTFGSMVWDQAEQDLVCDRVAPYPCMQQQLAESYRAQFDSDMPFVAVQLPGYASGVFPMRLAQARGANQTNSAAVIATYDLSCAFDATHGCPYGNVHNPSKVPVGQRVASQLLKMKLGKNLVTQGPELQTVRMEKIGPVSYGFTLEFAGGSAPYFFRGTRNCTTCCTSPVSDFDASPDAQNWFNGTNVEVQGNQVTFAVESPYPPKVVRYTANRVFPQCTLYNLEQLPALPFQAEV